MEEKPFLTASLLPNAKVSWIFSYWDHSVSLGVEEHEDLLEVGHLVLGEAGAFRGHGDLKIWKKK